MRSDEASYTHLKLVSGDAIHRDGQTTGAMKRRWKSIGGYKAEGFAVTDTNGVERIWTLHWGDALQLSYALPAPAHRRLASSPLFKIGETVATGFGAGVVTAFYRRDAGTGRAHWRYAIQMDTGASIDAAQSGVREAPVHFSKNNS